MFLCNTVNTIYRDATFVNYEYTKRNYMLQKRGENRMRQALGKRINQLRKSKGLTSEQLSELCGVNAVHIRRIESGGSLPSFSLFLKICNVLGTSADYLLGDLLEHPVIPDSVEQLGKQFKHMTPEQIEMISEMVEVMIRHTTTKE